MRFRGVISRAGWPGAALLVTWGGVSAWLAVEFSGRIRDWAVMTDELLYTKLATSIASSGSPLPEIHGTTVDVLSQLYPLLLAPFVGAFDVPDAFHAAHVFNAPLMASAVFPAYLLGRQVVGRLPALAVAVLSVVVPWMVLTGVLMTEAAAYPAFLWAVLAIQRAVSGEGRRGDLLAAGALVLAVLARTQFVVLVLVLPLAVLVHELASTRAGGAKAALARAVDRHRVLAGIYGAGAVVVAIVGVFGSLSSLLGTYAVTAHGSPLPPGIWRAAAAHLDAVAVGCGVLPLVVGGGWIVSTLFRASDSKAHSLAVVGSLTILALTFETASYDLRFGGAGVVRDRYVFYVVPLLFIGAAAAVTGERRRATAVAATALTALFAATVHFLAFPTSAAFWVDSPARALNHVYESQSGSLSTATFVALAGLALGIVVVLGLLLVPGRLLAPLVFVFLLSFSVLATRDQMDRVSTGTGSSGRLVTGPPGIVLDWVDKSVPAGTRAAIVPFPISSEFALSALRWWDIEFWNRSAQQTFVAADGHFSYAPFPNRKLVPDWSTGRIAGAGNAPAYLIAAINDPRFGVAGSTHAENLGFRVLLADRPYHAAWISHGLDTDGWVRSGRPATIRVFAAGGVAQRVAVGVTIDAPASAPASYVLTGGRATLSGKVDAAATITDHLTLCVPARSFADIALSSPSRVSIPNPPIAFDVRGSRRVGVRLGAVATTPTGEAC